MRTNLLVETLSVLETEKKAESDVRFCCVDDFWFTWETFKIYAENIDYDSGLGGNEIRMSLKIVGDDWWLERHEYDGSEWWEFKTLPVKKGNETHCPVILYSFTNGKRYD